MAKKKFGARAGTGDPSDPATTTPASTPAPATSSTPTPSGDDDHGIDPTALAALGEIAIDMILKQGLTLLEVVEETKQDLDVVTLALEQCADSRFDATTIPFLSTRKGVKEFRKSNREENFVEKYWKQIAGGIAALVVIVLLVMWFNSGPSAEEEQATAEAKLQQQIAVLKDLLEKDRRSEDGLPPSEQKQFKEAGETEDGKWHIRAYMRKYPSYTPSVRIDGLVIPDRDDPADPADPSAPAPVTPGAPSTPSVTAEKKAVEDALNTLETTPWGTRAAVKMFAVQQFVEMLGRSNQLGLTQSLETRQKHFGALMSYTPGGSKFDFAGKRDGEKDVAVLKPRWKNVQDAYAAWTPVMQAEVAYFNSSGKTHATVNGWSAAQEKGVIQAWLDFDVSKLK